MSKYLRVIIKNILFWLCNNTLFQPNITYTNSTKIKRAHINGCVGFVCNDSGQNSFLIFPKEIKGIIQKTDWRQTGLVFSINFQRHNITLQFHNFIIIFVGHYFYYQKVKFSMN